MFYGVLIFFDFDSGNVELVECLIFNVVFDGLEIGRVGIWFLNVENIVIECWLLFDRENN